ncbi:MAG: hypothetical protein Q8Q09_23595 [Deltaproteobacteria bacterium]|nr:hypothetical protein [Deltaproteobacteria bacterium]
MSAHARLTLCVCTVILLSNVHCGPIVDETPSAQDPLGDRASGGERARGTADAGLTWDSATDAAADARPVIAHFSDELMRPDAGSARESGVQTWQADGDVAVAADAGVQAAELSWLVMHIADDADRAGASGAPNVRALARYGADGLRAVVPLFRLGDARRVEQARHVVETLAQRACRSTADPDAPRRLVAWLDGGAAVLRAPRPGPPDPRWPWQRGPEWPWSTAAIARLEAWAASDLVCDPRHLVAPASGRE